MEVWIERTPWSRESDVRLAARAGTKMQVATGVARDGRLTWTTMDANVEVPVFLRLPDDVLESLVRAAGDVTQASDQTVESLKDARAVRDRLLSLVEHSAKAAA